MTDAVRALWGLLNLAMVPKWNGIPIVGLAELAIMGVLLLLLNCATTPQARAARAPRTLVVRADG